MSVITKTIKFTNKLLKDLNIMDLNIYIEQKLKSNNDFIFQKFDIINGTQIIIKTYDKKIISFTIKYGFKVVNDEEIIDTIDLYSKEKHILNIKNGNDWKPSIWNQYLKEKKARKIIIKLRLSKGVFFLNDLNTITKNISNNFNIIIRNKTNGNTSIFALIVNGMLINQDENAKYLLILKSNTFFKLTKNNLDEWMNQFDISKIIYITERNCKDDTCDCNKVPNQNYICCLCGHIKDITLNIIEESITDITNNITFLSSCGHTFHKICLQKYMEIYGTDANHESIICPLKNCDSTKYYDSTINQNILIRSQNKYYKYYKKYNKYKKKYINKKNILNII